MSNIDKAIYIVELNKAMRKQAAAANELLHLKDTIEQATNELAEAVLHFDAANIEIKILNNHPLFGNKINTEIKNLNKSVAL